MCIALLTIVGKFSPWLALVISTEVALQKSTQSKNSIVRKKRVNFVIYQNSTKK